MEMSWRDTKHLTVCTVYVGSQMLAVQYRDQSNTHMENEFSKIGEKKKKLSIFSISVVEKKFHLYIKYVYFV